MLNNSAVEYWSKQPTDQPWLLNGFTGTFAYSDHRKIPEGILEFCSNTFTNVWAMHVSIISNQ